MSYKVLLTKSAQKDVEKLKAASLSEKAKSLIDILKEDPYRNPPPYEKLRGSLQGFFSRRINIKHRLVYRVDEEKKEVIVIALWTHYESL